MIKGFSMSDEPKRDTINKLNRIPMYMNDKLTLLVSYGYFIKR
jgi:hypothetical protein